MERRIFILGGLVATMTPILSACYQYPGYGPPPHAPAHGYRRKHPAGVELVFDRGLGVYVVVGRPYYFHNERFYWLRDGRWVVSVNANGPWHPVSHDSLPPGLRKKGGDGPPGRGRGRGPY